MSKYVRQEKSLRKHPVASSATSPRRPPTVAAAPKERPGWKGPGFIKKSSGLKQQSQNAQSSRVVAPEQEQQLSVESQQLLLDVFRTALPICQDYEFLKVTLHEIRVAISKGDYETAFSRSDWLGAYAVRWCPHRALCYANVVLEMGDKFPEERWFKDFLGTRAKESGDTDSLRATNLTEQIPTVVCFGGGAAEIMTFAALLRHHRSQSSTADAASFDSKISNKYLESGSRPSLPDLSLLLIDLADWTTVVSALDLGLKTPPPLSKYASQRAIDNSSAFIPPSSLHTSLKQSNILTTTHTDLVEMVGLQPSLVTLFFTLTDLNNSSTAKAAAFLLKLTLASPCGSLLLIIDKADVPDTIVVNNDTSSNKARYSTHQLLDHVLLEEHNTGVKGSWEQLVRDQHRSFKLNEALKFPVSLDNFTFQVHLFRKR